MIRRLATARRIAVGILAVVLALTVTWLSSSFERRGPELAAYGNLCGASGMEFCMGPVLNGGFPLPFLFDAPGVSVENSLGIGEDDFRPLPFALDALLYLALILGAWFAAKRRRSGARKRAR